MTPSVKGDPMFRAFIVSILATAFASPAVEARITSAKGDCYVQAVDARTLESEIRQLNPFDKQVMTTYAIGSFVDAIVGELDAGILGDGAMTVLTAEGKNTVVYEPFEGGPLTEKIRANLAQGMTEVAFYKGCLTELPPSSLKGKILIDLVQSALGLEGAERVFELKDR